MPGRYRMADSRVGARPQTRGHARAGGDDVGDWKCGARFGPTAAIQSNRPTTERVDRAPRRGAICL